MWSSAVEKEGGERGICKIGQPGGELRCGSGKQDVTERPAVAMTKINETHRRRRRDRCGVVGALAHGAARDAAVSVTPQAGVRAAVAHDEENTAARGAERGGRARLVRSDATGGIVAKVAHLQRVAVGGPADGAGGGYGKIRPKDVAARVQGGVLQHKVVLSLVANRN